MRRSVWSHTIYSLALTALVGCADTPLEHEQTEGDVDGAELGEVDSELLTKIVYRSINAGDPPATYYGAGNIQVKLSNNSKSGAAVEVQNFSGTPVNIEYAKITVKCQDGSGNFTYTSYPGKLNGGQYWGHVQLCNTKLLSASIEVKIVRP